MARFDLTNLEWSTIQPLLPNKPHGVQTLLADRAYDSDALRQRLAGRGAWANVKSMPNRKRQPASSRFLYKERNLVERVFNRIKHFRALDTRYDKLAENDFAGVQLASARIWMRANESMA